ncbi:coagulation factor V-like [Haliotis asinina]|uniref:coagulation factor V-like n=1 Tax=Haliotis asinina TaxID=109174 RepID=UPI00353216E7
MTTAGLLAVLLLTIAPSAVDGNCTAGIYECDWYPWASWGGCTETCGGNGIQTRNRGICCEADLEYADCVKKCNVPYLDGQMSQACGATCFNGGTFDGTICQCDVGFNGKCCEYVITSSTTSTTETPVPERVCQDRFWRTGIIKDDHVVSSSNAPGKTAVMANSDCKNKPCGWCPDPNLPIQDQYIEVTFEKAWVIQAIEIQPPEGTDPNSVVRNYMTNYTFQYQPVGGTKLVTYGTEHSGPIYMLGVRGNSVTVVSTLTEIQRPVSERIRISVVDAENHACFRFEIFGCENLCKCQNGGSCISKNTCLCPPPYYGPDCTYIHLPEIGGCLKPLGMWNHNITDDQLIVSSAAPDHGKEKARYICCAGETNGAWCPAANDTKPYYEVRLSKPHIVAMLMFEQPNVQHYWELPDTFMKTFTLQYHNVYNDVMETYVKGADAIYNSTVSYSPILDPYLLTDVIRIYPVTWEKAPCFRMEIIGCDPDEGPAGAFRPESGILGRKRRDIKYSLKGPPANRHLNM